jgi:hypothetical protein
MRSVFCLFFLTLFFLSPATGADLSLNLYEPALARVYSGRETLHYSISWSGGIKIGDLYLWLEPQDSGDGLVIRARVTDYGLFRFFYPVDDTFITFVSGPYKLPFRYDVHQKEGSSMDVRRLTLYDQSKFTVRYRKNTDPEVEYAMDGPAYNEFSSFYITRVLQLDPAQEQIVPTFVDGKRHRVAVKVFEKERRRTLFGKIDTVKIMPRMSFKGLYDKDGDTVFRLTDDECRVPVEIRSRILIGSLVAELVDYSNPACSLVKEQKRRPDLGEDDLL